MLVIGKSRFFYDAALVWHCQLALAPLGLMRLPYETTLLALFCGFYQKQLLRHVVTGKTTFSSFHQFVPYSTSRQEHHLCAVVSAAETLAADPAKS